MTVLTRRLVAAATGLSLALSATPSFAMGIGIAGDADVTIEHDNREDAMMRARTQKMQRANDGSAHANADDAKMMRLKANANASVQTRSMEDIAARMRTRALAIIKRAVRSIAAFAQRACNADTSTIDATTCMANAKASLKADIDIIVDASFGA